MAFVSLALRLASRTLAIAALSAGSIACTALGPLPATTGVDARPAGRPAVDASVGAVPGYYLSEAVRESPEGTAIRQAAVAVEVGEWIGVPGLIAGGRYIAEDDHYAEPLLGYRVALDTEERFAASVIAHGAHIADSAEGASYSATRAGLELVADARLTPKSHWVELHAALGVAAAGLAAKGEYCVDTEQRFGVDCPDDAVTTVRAEASGLYPAASAALALDFGRHLPSVFHGARAAVHGAAGSMPRVESGEQVSPAAFAAAGLSLTLRLGAIE